MMRKNTKIGIKDWIWNSYLKFSLIPIFVLGLFFFAATHLTHARSINNMTKYTTEQVQEELIKANSQDVDNIDQQLESINALARVYALQTSAALNSNTELSPEDSSRLDYDPSGVYYSTSDTVEGGAAVFYSGIVPIGETEREKVAHVLQTQQLMEDIQTSYPIVALIYLNTYDSLNVIYPYFDVLSQYPSHMDIPTYNFYYEADAEHNSDRGVEWTDVYLDPAGCGWMASCIMPVYNGDFLEGVVGLDVTVSTITQQVLDLDVPWDGYAMLVGGDGMILALPENGEDDWGLTELTDHTYEEAIMEDTFKPSEFNLKNMDALSGFTGEFIENNSGLSSIVLKGQEKVVSWNTIEETGWKLLYIVPEATIYAGVTDIRDNDILVSSFVLGALLIVYILLFIAYYKKSRSLGHKISQPLLTINHIVESIGNGEYKQNSVNFEVTEFQETLEYIIEMGVQLERANKKLMATQKDLKGREAYLQALVNSLDDVVFELDENGTVKNFRTNDPDIRTHIFPDGITESTTLEAFMSKSESADYLSATRKVINTGETATIEHKTDNPHGERWFLARIALIGDESRTVAVSLRDITERKEMEKNITEARIVAEEASLAKSQFLSNMSHELRTPLNAVLGFAQVLEIDPEAPLNDSQQECVHEIEKAGTHLLELINEVLDLAKIESGHLSISIEPVEVAQIVEETLALVKPVADKYGIELVSNYKHCDRYVKTDKIRIKQVFINLISNAIKYNKENGKVTFYCEPSDGCVRFHVVDTGIGIPESQLEEIFKPFNRLNASKNTVEGTGIGLAVVKQLVGLMGGNVFVESTIGEGSHFYIEIPETPMKELKHESITSKQEYITNDSENQSQYKLLYVEDNPANLKLVQHIISYMPQMELISASFAGIGIDLARAHRPNLILLDINLPDMDGYEAFKRLRSYPETESIPVIALSANAMEKDIKKALNIGFTDYITKPIDIAEFTEKLKNILFGKNNN